MAGEINFGILQQPDYAGNALAYYGVGQRNRAQRERRNALLMADSDPLGAISALERQGDFETADRLRVGQERQRIARVRTEVAPMVQAGKYGEAMKASLAGGDSDYAADIAKMSEVERADNLRKLEEGTRLYASLLPLPKEQRAAKLKGLGLPDDKIAGLDLSDAGIRSEIMKAAPVADLIKQSLPDWRKLDDGRYVDFNDPRNLQPEGGQAGQGEPRQGATPGGGNDPYAATFEALVQQESGGQPGVLGPQTDYGRAEGMTQMLPATAQSMAQKLGLPWRPELMRGATPEAAQYQRTLGRAYFDEGLERYGGDVNKALMYYHGGPDERLWGPKTRRYAQEVQARMQAGQPPAPAQPYQVASNGPTPPPPSGGQQFGGRVIGQATPPEWEAREGVLYNRRTGDMKDDPRATAGVAPPPGAGLTSLGGTFYRDSIGRVYQPDKSGKMVQTVGVTDQAVQKATETMTAANTLMQAVDEFNRAAVAMKPTEFGPQGKYLGNPEKYARVKAAATNLQMMLKGPAAYNLGVITGPDLAILEGVVADPAKLDTAIRAGQIVPALRQLGNSIGFKVRSEREGFKALGGDPRGLPAFYADTVRAERKAAAERGRASAQSARAVNAPRGAIDMLKKNPSLAAAFDAKYGAGSAASVLGR